MNTEQITDWCEGITEATERLMQPLVTLVMNATDPSQDRLEEWGPASNWEERY